MFFCSQLFGFFPLGLCRWQPRNRQTHRQVCWKRHRRSGVVGKQRNIVFFLFLGNVEPKWCRKYRKWLCCKIFVTKSKLKASLAVWRNLLPYIFQGGLQPGSPPRRAAPAQCKDHCYFNLTKHYNGHLTLTRRTKNWAWRCEQTNKATMLRSQHSRECAWSDVPWFERVSNWSTVTCMTFWNSTIIVMHTWAYIRNEKYIFNCIWTSGEEARSLFAAQYFYRSCLWMPLSSGSSVSSTAPRYLYWLADFRFLPPLC